MDQDSHNCGEAGDNSDAPMRLIFNKSKVEHLNLS